MSTRYVWEKYAIDVTVTTGSNEFTLDVKFPDNKPPHLYACTDYIAKLDSDGNIIYTPAGSYVEMINPDIEPQNTYTYLILNDWARYSTNYKGYHLFERSNTSGKSWVIGNVAGGYVRVYAPCFYCTATKTKGASLGKVSSASSNTYPKDGQSGNYWYKYLGSDVIDPTAVSYSKSEPKGGDTVTVSVTPRSNTYGGTIRSQYQYQVNGGSWTDSGSRTTNTSKDFTIPKGATTFRVRVQASDDWGFTSTDYVYGSTLAVQNLTAYVGVNGVAREIDKMYIGVNGVAREVVAAYVGVNGVARELF